MVETSWPDDIDGDDQASTRHDSIITHFHNKAPDQSSVDSPILSLPEELRILIYHSLLSTDLHLNLGIESSAAALSSVSTLGSTCRQIHAEFSPLLHRLPTFHLHLPLLQDPVRPTSSGSSVSGSRPTSSSSASQPFEGPAAARHLRRISEEFRDAVVLANGAGSVGHAQAAIAHFSRVCVRIPAVGEVMVHLGAQTRATFLPAFHSAWAAVVPGLRVLKEKAGEVRIRFALRLSKRMVGTYEFGISKGPGRALREMDAGIECDGRYAGWEPTLLEMGAVNEVRRSVGDAVWPDEEVGYWDGSVIP